MFPISAKKCEKCEIFSGIFALKFCEFWRFFSCQKPAFFFPPKTVDSRGSRRLALVCRRNREEKLQKLDEGPFFLFGDQHEIGEKDAFIGVMTFFFFLEITFKPDKSDEKIFGIFTLSLECSHYFRHFRRRWKLTGNTGSEIRKSLNIEPLLLRIERSQLRWFGHVSRMPQERLPKQALLAKGKREKTSWTT